jgi:hypothetical protein
MSDDARGADPYLALVDEAAHRAAVDARIAEREHHAFATRLATWVGVLRDLAEARAPVAIGTVSRGCRDGTLVAVGLDHVVLQLPHGSVALIALDEVTTLRPGPGARGPVATGARERPQDRTLVEALERLVVHGEVLVGVNGTTGPFRGTVLGLGEDVLTLRLLGADRATVYLPVAQIREVVVER